MPRTASLSLPRPLALAFALALAAFAAVSVSGHRVIQTEYGHEGEEPPAYFEPYNPGFVGSWTNPNNDGRWRVNPGDGRSNQHPNIFEGVHPRQVCPNMTEPDSQGHHYCSHKAAGYCDRRSGACLCFRGYQGLDCSGCRPTHYKDGDLCKPKTNCPSDCSGAGTCDYATGTCKCESFRLGDDCSIPFCEQYDEFCVECDQFHCDRCLEGYFVHPTNNTCVPCTTHDPRCTVCNSQECLQCQDPLLKSIRRSGRRRQDQRLPFDELRRELSDTNPHMNQARFAYDEAEKFYLTNDVAALAGIGFQRSTAATTDEVYFYLDNSTVPPADGDPLARDLRDVSVACRQGEQFDAAWHCRPFPVSHRVCGHPGLFSFSSPTYHMREFEQEIEITVVRSGGGLGRAAVRYNLIHNTTTVDDVTPTAVYTTTQTLVFEHGQIRKTFRVAVHDDNIPEADETFRLELSEPTNGATLGNQWITQVKIFDDEFHPLYIINHLNTTIRDVTGPAVDNVTYVAGEESAFIIETRDFAGNFVPSSIRSDQVVVEIWDQAAMWNSELGFDGGVGAHDYRDAQDGELSNFRGAAAGEPRTTVITGRAEDGGQLDGVWDAEVVPIKRGTFDLHIKHATRYGLYADYFDNPYLLGDPVISRKDHIVNHTFGTGRITQYATDFASVRWTGYLLNTVSGDHTFHVHANDNVRLWVDYELIIDKWWSPTNDSFGTIFLVEQRLYAIRLEYRDLDGDAFCYLSWTPPGGERHVVPSANLYAPRHIPGSPFTLNVKAGIAHANDTGLPGGSVAIGAGLVAGVAGTTSHFSIFSKDVYGNDRLGDACDDVFRVLAVRRPGSGTGPFGNSEGIGLEEVAGVATFNPDTFLIDVAWHPTRAGIYDLNVELWVDWREYEHIYGSPFRVVIDPAPTNAEESDVFGVGIQQGIAGTLFNFTIVARDASGNLRGVTGDPWSILAAHTEQSLGVEASCVDPFENGTYSCSYRPLVQGAYLLYVTLDGLQVRNSPYNVTVHVAPTDGSRCIAEGPGLTDAVEGVQTYFDVFIRDSFDNPRYGDGMDDFYVNLTVSVPEVLGAAVFFAEDFYRVTYTATTAGILDLTVIVEGLEITGSPFHPLVVPGAAYAPTSSADGLGLTYGVAGKLPEFLVQVRDTTGNEKITGEDSVTVTSTATQPTPGGPVTVITTHDCEYTGSSGVYLCVYNATVAATHTLDVLVNGAHIDLSPFTPLIVPAEMNPLTSVASGTGLEYVVAGDLAPVYIRPVDEFGNDLLRALDTSVEILTAALKGVGPSGQGDHSNLGLGPEQPEAELPITDFENGTLWVGYTPLVSGDYLLTFDQVLGEGLDGTYFETDDFLRPVVTRTDTTVDFDWGDRRPPVLPEQGELYSVRWEGFFRPTVSEVHRFRITSTGNVRLRVGQPRTSLVQSASGTGTAVPDDPTGGLQDLADAVTVIEAFPSTTYHHTGDLRLQAGLWYPVIVEFSDVDGRDGTISWTYSTPSLADRVVPTAQLYRGLSYPVSLSPYSPLVVPAPASPINCVALGAGLHNAVSNITSSFVVHVRDRFNNSRAYWRGGDNVTVVADRVGGPPLDDPALATATFSGTVVDLGNAFYQVTYVPEVSGTYHLSIFVNQNFTDPDFGATVAEDANELAHIEGSPFLLVVDDDGGYGPTSTSFGAGRDNAMAGVEDHFQVQARDVNGNNRTDPDAVLVQLDLRPGQGQPVRGVRVFGTAVHAGNGLYDVYYTATHAYYYDLSVVVNGLHALASPYEMFLTPAPADAPVTDTEHVINSTSVAGQDTYFTVFARDEFGNLRLDGGEEFVVRLVGPTTQQRTVIVTQGVVHDNNNGTYTVVYNVPIPGFYNVHVDLATDRRHPRGLLGEFFTNRFLFGDPVWTQVDDYIDERFDTPGVPQLTRYASVYHSARWSGFIQAPDNGTFTFTVESDDGVRLFVDTQLVIDEIEGPPGNHTGTVPDRLLANALYAITLEYVQLTGPAAVKLQWSWSDGVGDAVATHVVPNSRLFSAAMPISGSPFNMNAT